MANTIDNPFRIDREPRDRIVPVRFTASEYAALKDRAKLERVSISDLARRAFANVLDEPFPITGEQ